MNIFRAGSTPSRPGPGDWFTGKVRIDALFNPADPARVQGNMSPSSRAPAPHGTAIRWARR